MFSQEVADTICARLAEGLSLRKACEQEGAKVPTILLWVDSHPAFAEQYTRARAVGYALLADEILEISDGDGDALGDKLDQERVARARLRVDSRKWMLSKMLPKIYGDKTETAITGRITVAREMTDEELASIAAAGGS